MTQLRQSLRLVLAALLTAALCIHLHWGQQSVWLMVSALMALQISSYPLPQHKSIFLLGTGFIASLTAVVSCIVGTKTLYIAFYLFFTTFCTLTVGLNWPVLWGAAFVVNFFGTLSYIFMTDYAAALQRGGAIFAGFFLALLLLKLFFPQRLRDGVRLLLAQAVQELMGLSAALFNCYLSADYLENRFDYLSKFHARRRAFAYHLSMARELLAQMRPSARVESARQLEKTETLYEIILALGTLLNREKDHSTFAIVTKEFLNINENISAELRALKLLLLKQKKLPPVNNDLEENIYQLEDVNRSAVNVAARDPMVFLLFVQDLSSLAVALRDLRSELAPVAEIS
jgi:hypothetical protein